MCIKGKEENVPIKREKKRLPIHLLSDLPHLIPTTLCKTLLPDQFIAQYVSICLINLDLNS